jgi:hypothetical protein
MKIFVHFYAVRNYTGIQINLKFSHCFNALKLKNPEFVIENIQNPMMREIFEDKDCVISTPSRVGMRTFLFLEKVTGNHSPT